jgi:hypothetical protein
MLYLVRFSLLLSLGVVAMAQPPSKPPEARQFDFWVGTWEVSAQGKVAGENRIESILGGWALRESYATKGAYAGHSYNSYNAPAQRWEQFWVDNSGTVLHLTGGLNGEGEMVLSGERITSDGSVVDRITWTPRDDGSVRQHWEVSSDGGATWETAFDGIYRRVEEEKPSASS